MAVKVQKLDLNPGFENVCLDIMLLLMIFLFQMLLGYRQKTSIAKKVALATAHVPVTKQLLNSVANACLELQMKKAFVSVSLLKLIKSLTTCIHPLKLQIRMPSTFLHF